VDPARSKLTDDLDRLLLLLDVLDSIDAVARAHDNNRLSGLDGDLGGHLDRLSAVPPAHLHRLTYAVVIALGYASFERFIRDSIEATATLLAEAVPTYAQLPDVMRDHHARLTMKVATRRVDRDASDVAADLLGTLIGCLDGDGAFTLNSEVFSDRAANFRSELLRDTYRRVDVIVPQEVISPAIADLLDGPLNGLYARSSSVVDDLASRRNDVAHGDDYEILDRSTLRALVAFITAYADAISSIIFDSTARVLARTCGTLISHVDHVWSHPNTQERTLARVHPTGGTLAVSDLVLIGGRTWRLAHVVSIQRNRVPVDACGPSEDAHGVDFGIEIRRGEQVVALPAGAFGGLAPLLA
jgi:hypothetical protein